MFKNYYISVFEQKNVKISDQMEDSPQKPYIFGHRGAMGYEIENTIPSFSKALEMGAGIETDIQLTKDKILVCFHDSVFKIDQHRYEIKKLTLNELKQINFNDKRKIPTLDEVFKKFQDEDNNLRYSVDIFDEETGIEVIELAKKYKILEKVEITDKRLDILSDLRNYDKNVKLVHTLPLNILDFNACESNFEEMKCNEINTINIKADKNRLKNNLPCIIDNGFKCYCWGVNYKSQMKKVLKWKHKNEIVEAIYTNYPDVLISLRENYFS